LNNQQKSQPTLFKSDLVERKPSIHREKTEISFDKKQAVDLDEVKINSIDKLRYNISKFSRETIFKSKLLLELYKLKRSIDMKQNLLEQLKHKPLWLKIIGIILMILGFFGINTEFISAQADQIATIITGILTLFYGFKKEKEEEKAVKDIK
jgi:hypothetical protein